MSPRKRNYLQKNVKLFIRWVRKESEVLLPQIITCCGEEVSGLGEKTEDAERHPANQQIKTGPLRTVLTFSIKTGPLRTVLTFSIAKFGQIKKNKGKTQPEERTAVIIACCCLTVLNTLSLYGMP